MMKIIFMGNSAIACPILNALNNSKHDLLAVVSNSPKRFGRGRSLSYTPVGKLAKDIKLNFIPAESLTDPDLYTRLKTLKPDIYVVVAFRILPNALLEIPKMGAMNLHTSLLPKYRGAAPIQHAIMNGDKETGLTTFIIEPKVDTGSIILQERMNIEPDDDFESISEKRSKNADFKGKISIDIKDDSDYIYVTVKDNGVGFDRVDKKKMLTPYFTTKKDGTGLGLAIVTKIISDHNSLILFDSIKNGAKVEITIPKHHA